ncbi:MAG: hypothetical protein WCC26_07415 [Terracidiphilus sp.]
MRIAHFLAVVAVCVLYTRASVAAPNAPGTKTATSALDSDHDGLSDALEQALLVRFEPSFQVDPQDCAGVPAAFLPDRSKPVVAAEDGTLYGQATPRTLSGMAGRLVELRYFHLWKSDCGRMGHALDAEHVSVLIQAQPDTDGAAGWHALYWYAAAHQDTVCDASQITRAATLAAENAGAPVWISRGKHASFLNQDLCRHGCGGDWCGSMHPLSVRRIVNLGEEQAPMNGSLWIDSAAWPLAAKMTRSDFDPEALARLQKLPSSDIAWVTPSKRPMEATIAAGGSTEGALAMGEGKTDTAISLAADDAGNAIGNTYGKVTHSLKKSARAVGRFLRGGSHKPTKDTADQWQAPARP